MKKKEVRKVKGVLVVLLAALLLGAVGALPVFAGEEDSENIAEVVKEEPVITKEDIKSAKVTEGALVLELAEPEEFVEKWQKYIYFDADQDQNTNSQTYWTRLGTRKGPFDISIGWNQRFNQPATEDVDKGMLNLSMSIWW